jgi:hypothetical protein
MLDSTLGQGCTYGFDSGKKKSIKHAHGCVPLPLLRLAEACCTAAAVYATPAPSMFLQGKDGAQGPAHQVWSVTPVITSVVTRLCTLDFASRCQWFPLGLAAPFICVAPSLRVLLSGHARTPCHLEPEPLSLNDLAGSGAHSPRQRAIAPFSAFPIHQLKAFQFGSSRKHVA